MILKLYLNLVLTGTSVLALLRQNIQDMKFKGRITVKQGMKAPMNTISLLKKVFDS